MEDHKTVYLIDAAHSTCPSGWPDLEWFTLSVNSELVEKLARTWTAMKGLNLEDCRIDVEGFFGPASQAEVARLEPSSLVITWDGTVYADAVPKHGNWHAQTEPITIEELRRIFNRSLDGEVINAGLEDELNIDEPTIFEKAKAEHLCVI